MRRAFAVLLAVLLAAPPMDLSATPRSGTIRGTVTLGSRPLAGIGLAFLDVATGEVYRATSSAVGRFEAQVPPGQYVIATENAVGLVVSRGPMTVSVAPSDVTSADVELLALPGAAQDPVAPPPPAQEQPAPSPAPTSTVIDHDPVGCMVAGQFPLIESKIEPAASVARARVYFRAAQGEIWYYVEMTPSESGFMGKLPRPKLEASPVNYYIQASTTELGEGQTPEISAIVVAEPGDCPDDKKVAAIGPPGEVTVFSAATGAAIAPVGFAAGGLALTLGTILLLAGGAAALGITAAITVFNPEPTPTPVAVATPTPPPPPPPPVVIPSPSPEPTPPPITPFR